MKPPKDFEPDWTWIDDGGTSVYAQGYGRGLTAIFSFDADTRKPPTTLANRVCTKFEGLETNDPAHTFATIGDMHDAIWAAINHIWPQCASHPDLRAKLDTVVRVDSPDASIEKVSWSLYSHPRFPQFINDLADEDCPATVDTSESVDFASLVRYEQLGGRGCTTRVRLPDAQDMVFKGIDFRTALQHSDEEDNRIIRNLIGVWRREFNILHKLPPHPNIMPPPKMLATIQWPDQSARPVSCGALFPFYPGGNVASRIENSNENGLRISLELKAHWCADMAAAVHHVHRVAKTYHMDIKPGNFVATASDDLILCDWEQHDAPPTTIAPEADGTWDVMEEISVRTSGRPRLRYTKYTGAPRRNVEEGVLGDAPWHTWSVFPMWSNEHPWALELAEVFSLGRSMWMLLRQPESDFEGIEHPDQLITDWDRCEDLPASWKRMVDQSTSPNANDRPDLAELLDFWTTEWSAQTAANSHTAPSAVSSPV